MLRLGKLDNDDLERLVLKKFRRVRPEPLSAPAIGQDCATLDLGGDLVLLSCDPITSAGHRASGAVDGARQLQRRGQLPARNRSAFS